jgi:gluconokinase
VIVVVMGVAGCGKTHVGAALAERLGLAFIEGDAHHPETNVAKMSAGQPLTDADRIPWLDRLATEMAPHRTSGGCVVACSALKRSYRDRLTRGSADVVFVHLEAPRPVLEERLRERSEHFMPASLLDSQLAALEPPQPDEPALSFDSTEPRTPLVERIAAKLHQATSPKSS